MKVLTVIGARPQFIKAAMVSRAFREVPSIQEHLLHTGQHFDANMSDIFFDELEIPKPSVHLGLGSGSHGAMTGRMLEGIEKTLLELRPDWVLVYGDTNSTLAGALAAIKLHIPVAHVEAGLRSFNRRMPEEVNRVMTDHCSELLFAPTATAISNLAKEGVPDFRCHNVGDVMFDAALFYGAKAELQSGVMSAFGLSPKNFILATIHRQENTDDPIRLRRIFEGLAEVAREVPVVMPVHPRTRQALARVGIPEAMLQGLTFTDPLGYLDMVQLERHARLVVTDSGGVQKEAFFYGVPCVTLRDETEWVELLENGWNRLAPPLEEGQVAQGIRNALNAPLPTGASSPYGTGAAGAKIVQILQGA